MTYRLTRRMMFRCWTVSLAALALAAGCTNPDLAGNRWQCVGDESCPSGSVCVDGVCTPLDQAGDASANPDAEVPDASAGHDVAVDGPADTDDDVAPIDAGDGGREDVPPTPDTNADSGPDSGPDTTRDVAPDVETCEDGCPFEGAHRCADGADSVCARGDDGCLAWSAAVACDDDDICTVDSCDESTGCVHTPACDDANACTVDTCDPTDGCHHEPLDCDDADPCTLDTCDEESGCAHAPRECDDGNPCTLDTCESAVEGGCVFTPADPGAGCDDGDPCTTNDRCEANGEAFECVADPVDCDDGNPCTTDECDAAGACTHEPAGFLDCDDGDPCTTGDQCYEGACVGLGARNCDDGNPCTTDRCDSEAAAGAEPCVNTPRPDGYGCSDGDPCTLDDRCVVAESGQAVCAGTPNDCDDGNPCTEGECQANGTCSQTPLDAVPCDDEDACTTASSCENGVCRGSGALDCDDGNPCTQDTCQAAHGCVNAGLPLDMGCDDGDACTVEDGCQPSGSTMICVGTARTCDDANPCTQNTCDSAAGCVEQPAPDGTECDDGDPCTENTACSAGQCIGGTAPDCDDGNVCTTDRCDSASGGCVHPSVGNGTDCDDGDPCTVGDRCVAGQCVPVTSATEGIPCDDGNTCTVTDVCAQGVCWGAGVLDCDDGESCTQDICVPESGCHHERLPDEMPCDDGDACVSGTTCHEGVCTGGAVVDCDDLNQCTADSCDPDLGCENSFLTAGTDCDDGDPCTDADTCDGAGSCVAGSEICDVCEESAFLDCAGAGADSHAGSGSLHYPDDITSYSGGTCIPSMFAGREVTYGIRNTDGSGLEVFWTDRDGAPLAAWYGFRVLEDDQGCNPAACLADTVDAVVSVPTEAGQTYYTVLDHVTDGHDVPDHRVHARRTDGLTCAPSISSDEPVSCDMAGQGNALGTNPHFYPPQCTGGVAKSFEGRERVFTWSSSGGGAETTDVTVFLTDGYGDPDYTVFVLYAGTPPADCDNPSPSLCLASSHDGSTNGAFHTASFVATASDVYCIVVDSQDATLTESFVLSVGTFGTY